MKKIKWQDKYLLGDQIIDNEHQIFAHLINKLIMAVNDKKSNKYLERLVLEVQKYGEFHFVSEENYMMDIGYYDLQEHQKQHVLLIEKFSRSQSYIELGEKTYEDFIFFLIDWFRHHTINQDKKIVDFITNSSKREK